MKLKSQRFSHHAAEILGNYVYALIDPGKKSDLSGIFYVGRDKKQRCFEHAEDELKVDREERLTLKLNVIRQIRKRTRRSPPVRIIAFGLAIAESKRLEAILIRLLRRQLHNRCQGEAFGQTWLWAEDVEALFDATVQEHKLPGVTLLVSLNGSRDHTLPPWPEIRDKEKTVVRRTLGYWWKQEVKDPKHVQWVMGIYGGVIRTVFRVARNSRGDAKYKGYERASSSGKSRQVRYRFQGKRMPQEESYLRGRRVITVNDRNLTAFTGNGSRLVNAGEPSR